MTIKEMQESHLDFLRNMADATIVTPTYSIWANAYDDYSNRFILESSSKVEPSAVNRMVAGSSPASPATLWINKKQPPRASKGYSSTVTGG